MNDVPPLPTAAGEPMEKEQNPYQAPRNARGESRTDGPMSLSWREIQLVLIVVVFLAGMLLPALRPARESGTYKRTTPQQPANEP